MNTDTPRTDAAWNTYGDDYELELFARQLERELKEIRNALGDDGRRTHKEILEMAFKASGWKLWKEKYIDLRNAHIAEGQDPAGTIWEHADKLQKELKETKAEVEMFRKEIAYREKLDAVAQEVWDEMKAEVAKLNHQLLKTESDLLQSQDINSFLDTEFRIATKRAEKAEAEVERLKEAEALAHKPNVKLDQRKFGKQGWWYKKLANDN